jgi:hypothetical protein
MKTALLVGVVAVIGLSGCVGYVPYDQGYNAQPVYRNDNRVYRDRDGDGIPNRRDHDRDGDGIRNREDRQPNNPNRY